MDKPELRAGRLSRRAASAYALLACVLCLLAVGSCAPEGESQVVARVGERAITVGDLLARLRAERGPSTLVAMIDEVLIETAAEKEGIVVHPSELDLRLQRAIAECGSERDFAATLQQRGISRDDFLGQLRRDLLLDKLAMAHMQIAEQEVRDFYREHPEQFSHGEQVRARMMLFPTREDAEAVRETLMAGGDFAGLAQALSSDPATRDKGGDMGAFERGDYASAITDVAFALKPGEISEVFQAPDGWVILKVEERLPAARQPLEEVRDRVLAQIRRAKLPDARESWMRHARAQAAITISDEQLRAATLQLLEQAPAPAPVSLLPIPLPQGQ